MASPRRYERTHPWIKFKVNLQDTARPLLWMLLGEARSKCEHIAGVPLPPSVARDLHILYLAKGIKGTTAIEGNTLTLEQVEQHLRGDLVLPASQKYLQKEIDNILEACKAIGRDRFHDNNPEITPALIKFFNKTVLDGLELEEGVIPGDVRTHDVGVIRYLAAPAGDCEHLLDRLCGWLNSSDFSPHSDFGLAVPILKAIVAHLYIAWIHPFGDGNGRTARLLEYYILVHAGVPTPAAHLLSNHYNLTRAAYYRELDKASRSGGNVEPFIVYALQGFVDQLAEQILQIQAHQISVAWRDYVNERFEGKSSQAEIRRKLLVFHLSWREPLRRREMLELPQIARLYQGKTKKTLTRDLNSLITDGLAENTASGYRAMAETILAFLPGRRAQKEQLKVIGRRQLDLPQIQS